MSGVFATAGAGDVRVWCLETCQELLRIVVPNFTCSAVLFSGDGKSIVTGTETLLPKIMSIRVLVSLLSRQHSRVSLNDDRARNTDSLDGIRPYSAIHPFPSQ